MGEMEFEQRELVKAVNLAVHEMIWCLIPPINQEQRHQRHHRRREWNNKIEKSSEQDFRGLSAIKKGLSVNI